MKTVTQMTHAERCASIVQMILEGSARPLYRNDNPQESRTCQECAGEFRGHVLELYCRRCRPVVQWRQNAAASRRWNDGRVG